MAGTNTYRSAMGSAYGKNVDARNLMNPIDLGYAYSQPQESGAGKAKGFMMNALNDIVNFGMGGMVDLYNPAGLAYGAMNVANKYRNRAINNDEMSREREMTDAIQNAYRTSGVKFNEDGSELPAGFFGAEGLNPTLISGNQEKINTAQQFNSLVNKGQQEQAGAYKMNNAPGVDGSRGLPRYARNDMGLGNQGAENSIGILRFAQNDGVAGLGNHGGVPQAPQNDENIEPIGYKSTNVGGEFPLIQIEDSSNRLPHYARNDDNDGLESLLLNGSANYEMPQIVNPTQLNDFYKTGQSVAKNTIDNQREYYQTNANNQRALQVANLNAVTTRRGQDMVDARTREFATQLRPGRLPAGQAADLSATMQGIGQMDSLIKNSIPNLPWNMTTPGFAQASAINPWDTDAQAFQQYVNTYKQIIGKGLEGGVLRKEDEAKYEKIIPKVGDTRAVLNKKAAQLQDILINKYNGNMDAFNRANYDVSNFGYYGEQADDGGMAF